MDTDPVPEKLDCESVEVRETYRTPGRIPGAFYPQYFSGSTQILKATDHAAGQNPSHYSKIIIAEDRDQRHEPRESGCWSFRPAFSPSRFETAEATSTFRTSDDIKESVQGDSIDLDTNFPVPVTTMAPKAELASKRKGDELANPDGKASKLSDAAKTDNFAVSETTAEQGPTVPAMSTHGPTQSGPRAATPPVEEDDRSHAPVLQSASNTNNANEAAADNAREARVGEQDESAVPPDVPPTSFVPQQPSGEERGDLEFENIPLPRFPRRLFQSPAERERNAVEWYRRHRDTSRLMSRYILSRPLDPEMFPPELRYKEGFLWRGQEQAREEPPTAPGGGEADNGDHGSN